MTETPQQGFQLSHRQIMLVFSGLMLGMTLAALDQTIVATALPTIAVKLHGLSHYSWVVTAYLLTSTASTPLYGKLSDQYGRKIMFQIAIVVFLVGSALCGLAQNMTELAAFRAVQGMGAGGLLTLAMTIISDVVSPRERGRYQGYFGGVFALTSVAGPLLGGFFVDNLSWRWIFYINIPIGAVALVVTSTVLNLPFRRTPHRVDYFGVATLVAGVTALLLVTEWGGQTYAWSSPQIVFTALAGAVCIAVFVWWETRVAEPVMPLRLFRNDVFTVANVLMFLLGLVMFGTVIFLPVYLQLVHGASATKSGLLMLPLMAGVLVSSIGSGRLVSRLGRYKMFPVTGTALMTLGLFLMSRLTATTGYGTAGLYMVCVGLGMGMVMPNVMLAVQNAVDYRDMGTATSSVSFFRSMGGAFGTALFGAVLVARLDHFGSIALRHIPAAARAALPRGNIATQAGRIQALRGTQPQLYHVLVNMFVRSIHAVFLLGVPFAVVAFLFALMLRDVRLRETSGLGADAASGAPGGGAEAAAAGSVPAVH